MSGPTVVVGRRRGRRAAVLTAALTLLSGLLLALATTPTERVVGGAAAVVFAVATAVRLRPRPTTPALVLDDTGLTDQASATAAGFVPWSAVTGLREQRLRGRHYLSVLVADPNVVLTRADEATRAAMQANLAMLDTPVNIPLRPLATDLAELTLEFARRTPAALPAALTSRLPPGTEPRPAAAPAELDDLGARAAAAGITLPPAYLALLGEQDGWHGGPWRVFGSHSRDDLDGVLEATAAWRRAVADPAVTDSHVLLADDDGHRYSAHTSGTSFHILARSDHRLLGRVSTFSDLLAAALGKFPHPLG